MPKCTSKLVKYCGTQQYINPNTGEIEEFNVTNIEQRDFNFTKVFMENFLSDLDSLGNKKLKVAIYICQNITREGYFIGTVRNVAKNLGYSIKTVHTTINLLLECNFIKRAGIGVYLVNADHLFKGSHKNRMNILKKYHDLENDQVRALTNEQKLRNLRKTQQKIQQQIEILEKEE